MHDRKLAVEIYQGGLMKIVTLVCVVMSVLFAKSVQGNDFKATKIFEFSKYENVEPMVFQESQLWVAKSVNWAGTQYVNGVEVTDSTGSIHYATLELPFLPDRMYPFGGKQVIVVGKHYSDQWRTYFAVLTPNADSYSVSTTTLPTEYQVDEFTGSPEAMYFSEPGTNKIYRYKRSLFGATMTPLAPLIHGPGKMLIRDNNLWLIIRNGFQLGDENIGKIDLTSESMERTFPNLRNGITNLYALKNERLIVANEILNDQILFIDPDTNKLIKTVSITGGPYGFAELGSCLVVTVSKGVSFVKNFEVAHRWDLSVLGPNMDEPRNVVVDDKTNRLYIRSSNLCPTCEVTRNTVFVFEPGESVLKTCTAGK